MAVHYGTEGFVFKKEDRFDADRIFSVFTKDFGRVEVFGKAIRKIASKLKGNIEIFCFSELSFIQGKNKKILTDSALISKFSNLTKNPEKFLLAMRISEAIDSFIKNEQEDRKIWSLLIDTFEKLNHYTPRDNDQSLIYYYFIWNFVSALGYEPGLSMCAVCGNKLSPYNLYFSYKEGGVICGVCSVAKKDGIKTKSDIVKILRLVLKKDWDVLQKLKMETSYLESLMGISNNYYR